MSPGVVGVGHDMASVAASRSSTEARHATIGWRAYFERLLSDPRTDGNSQQVFFRRDESFELVVRQAPEGAIGVAPKPALQADDPRSLLRGDRLAAHVLGDGVVQNIVPRSTHRPNGSRAIGPVS